MKRLLCALAVLLAVTGCMGDGLYVANQTKPFTTAYDGYSGPYVELEENHSVDEILVVDSCGELIWRTTVSPVETRVDLDFPPERYSFIFMTDGETYTVYGLTNGTVTGHVVMRYDNDSDCPARGDGS